MNKKPIRKLGWLLPVLIAVTLLSFAHAATDTSDAKAFARFAQRMATRHGFEASKIKHLLAQSQRQQAILDAIASPAEALPWYRYRSIFLDEPRIRQGVLFWKQHQAVLHRALQRYGVPPQIIVAILGVETQYGRVLGDYRVIDALRTLAFDYPPRSEFFRSELEQYLLLCHEEGFNPLKPKGSYAGAMGIPQFISSSYRAYAVDFNHDGRRDLWNQPADAIGSVANYLNVHGWQRGEAIAVPASVIGKAWHSKVTPSLAVDTRIGELRAVGVTPERALPARRPAGLVVLEAKAGPEYWIGLRNFYVITRYNHSALYAMAVYQLSQAIRQRRGPDR